MIRRFILIFPTVPFRIQSHFVYFLFRILSHFVYSNFVCSHFVYCPISHTVPFCLLPFRILSQFVYCPISSTPISYTVPVRILSHFVYSNFVYLSQFAYCPILFTSISSAVPVRILSHFVYSHLITVPLRLLPHFVHSNSYMKLVYDLVKKTILYADVMSRNETFLTISVGSSVVDFTMLESNINLITVVSGSIISYFVFRS